MTDSPASHRDYEKIQERQLLQHILQCISPWPNGVRCEASDGLIQDCRDGYCRTYRIKLERVRG